MRDDLAYFYYTPSLFNYYVLTLAALPEGIEINSYTDRFQFCRELLFPIAIDIDISYSAKVARYLHSSIIQHRNSVAPQFGNTIPKLKYYILSRARTELLRFCFQAPLIVAGHDDDRKQ